MAKTQVLRYWMNIPDKALVDTLNAELDAGGGPTLVSVGSILVSSDMPNGLNQAPDNASAAILPSLYPPGPAPVINAGAALTSPSVSSEWFTGGFNYPTDVATFTRKSGGWFGIPLLFGTTTRFYWSGRFRYQLNPGDTEEVLDDSGDVVPPETLRTRYYLESFELGPGGNSASSWTSAGARTARDAGGAVEGLGVALRKSTAVPAVTQQTYNFIAGGVANAPSNMWDRIYFTVQHLPVGGVQVLFYSEGTPTASTGVVIGILPTGQLLLYNRDTGVATLMDTSEHLIEVGRPYRLDIVTHWNTVASPNNTGDCHVFLCGEEVMSFTSNVGIGSQGTPPQRQQTSNLSSYLSGIVAAADLSFEIDYHLMVGAAAPTSYSGIDWLHGSRAVLLEATAQDSDFANWTTGMFRLLGNRPPSRGDSQQLVSTTSGAIASYLTDVVKKLNNLQGADGIASFVIGLYGFRGTNSGTLGYALNGGAAVMTAITQSAGATPAWNRAFYSGPTAALAPIRPTALAVRYVKGADIVQAGIQIMAICAEVIGNFSRADLPLSDETEGSSVQSRVQGVHNSAYPDTPWGALDMPMISPYMLKTGTYVGNGATQDIQVNAPPCLLLIHRHSGTGDLGAWWATSFLGAHTDVEQGGDPVVRCLRDSSYAGAAAEDQQEMRFLIRLGNVDAQINTNAVTYSYFVVCDPGARFVLAHASVHSNASTLPIVDPLPVPDFTPEFALIWPEDLTNTSTDRLYGKDNALITADAALLVTGSAETANMYTFGAGQVTARVGLIGLMVAENINQILFRLSDGNDPLAGVPYAVVAWTGDGTASRTLSPDLGGKRPLYALVLGNLGGWRDPTHTTNTSGRLDTGASTTTGITAGGIDSVSVGSTFNSNGTPYLMLVFPGGTTAGNGGWSQDGEYWPIEPDSRVEDDWDEPTFIDTEPPDPVVEPPDDEPDLGDDCVEFTQKAVNIALSKIGQSMQVEDLVAEETQAATLARLHVKSDVEFTLAAFPWEFARKFATLVLVDGTLSDPVNEDWTYSYRQPTDCMFERRIVVARGSAVNPTAPPFALGRDSTGGLIYTNQTAAVLEYTARGLCPASEGDQLFKEALAWKLGASFAPGLTRMPEKVADCLANFQATIARAYDVQRPGSPGAGQEADPDALDQSAAATAANLSAVNRALIRIGARTVEALTSQAREATSARLIFEEELRAVLRDFPWANFTRYAELAVVAGPVTWDDALVQTWDVDRSYNENDAVSYSSTVYYALQAIAADPSGSNPAVDTANWTTEEPTAANGDWGRGYRLPTDYIFARRLVKETSRRVYDDAPFTFKVGTDDGGELLYTDAEQAVLEYTARIDGAVLRGDALFRDAFAWRLASSLAPSLAQVDPEELEQRGRGTDATALEGKRPPTRANAAQMRERVQRFALARYYDVLDQAKATNANEKQAEPDGDASWITGR